MKLPPDREDAVSAALRNVVSKAADATRPNDLAEIRKRLSEVRWAVWAAADAINEAEKATREDALSQLGKVA